jgi:DNA-binding IclR family transcriptional regulator
VRVIASVQKCLRLLDELAKSKHPLGVSELARTVGGTRGSVYQQLQTLVGSGWLEQTEQSLYRLTLRPLHIAAAALDQADLGARLTPILTELATASMENAAIAVLDGEEALIAQRVEGTQQVKADIKVGTRLPLARSASGRVLAVFGDPEQIARLGDGVKLPASKVAADVRANGYAWQLDELELGMASVAVPIRGVRPNDVRALSLTAPSARFNLDRSLALLRRAADQINQLVGGTA